jgi:hypothetical protein
VWEIIVEGVAVSVISTVILAAAASWWLMGTSHGRSFWANLGTSGLPPSTRVRGIRTIFITAALALVLALAALIIFVERAVLTPYATGQCPAQRFVGTMGRQIARKVLWYM